MRYTPSIGRLAAIAGITGALVLGLGGLSLASSGQGIVTLNPTGSNTGSVTWTWSGLGVGTTVYVYDAPQSNPGDTSEIASGTVTTAGSFTTSVTLNNNLTWSDAVIEVEESGLNAAQLPEVPWAAGLPLLLAVPLGWTLWRRAPRA
ncbi:MAG: hypothetical protein OWU33_09780 [Firmicutes bacterium]|nr:hypothetical protein [Bacillota bacterium]